MANPGIGYRTTCDVLCEISLHLLEPIVFTTITSFGEGGYSDGGYSEGGYSDPIGQLIGVVSQDAMYVGAQIVIGWGLDTAEVVTITEINSDGTILTTTAVNSHDPGEVVLAPTFPTQQPTDPFYTQSEMLGYLSRAQNEFLAECPVYYQLTQQSLTYGQIFQDTPANAVEINRVAISKMYIAIASLSRTDNTVTLASVDPHGLGVKSTIFVQNAEPGWGGVFEVLTAPSPTTLTYRQDADDDSTTEGAILYFKRMYETTQAEITMTQRNWQNSYQENPTQWFEDRTGLYRWGVGGRPASNYPVELLCSIRDDDTLELLDGFLLNDIIVYIIKYGALAYAFGKDGVQQDPSRARYCRARFDRGCMAVNRYLEGFKLGTEAASA